MAYTLSQIHLVTLKGQPYLPSHPEGAMRELEACGSLAHQNSLVATIGSLCERLHAFLEALTCCLRQRLARLLCQLDCRPLLSARSILLLIRKLYRRACGSWANDYPGAVEVPAAVQVLLGQKYCECELRVG